MGGGDLNMKKSFHPHTMQNLERVWKAEQKRDQERKKIDQLRRELQEERAREEMHRHAVETGVIKDRGQRLDWMYSGPGAAVNHDEYLLGKKIDKAVDPFATPAEEDPSTSAPGSLFTVSSGANSTVDLAAKIKEDPLFMMKKQEEQARKNLLRNPVRLKQLQDMLREQTEEMKSKSKKKDKKRKKKKKHRRAESSDSEDDRDGRHSASRSGHAARRSRSPEHRRYTHRAYEERFPSLRHSHRAESCHRRRKNGHRHLARSRSRSRSRSPLEHRHSSHQRPPRSRSPVRHSAAPFTSSHRRQRSPYGGHSHPVRSRLRSRSRSLSPSSHRHSSHHHPQPQSPVHHPAAPSTNQHFASSHRRQRSPPRHRLDPEEQERRRQQMISDAQTHEKDRLDRLKQRQDQMEKEETELRERNMSRDEQFSAPIRANALKNAAASTVEDRIHRNINKVQRTKASLDRKFTER